VLGAEVGNQTRESATLPRGRHRSVAGSRQADGGDGATQPRGRPGWLAAWWLAAWLAERWSSRSRSSPSPPRLDVLPMCSASKNFTTGFFIQL
jgi:hypothetical protein